MCITSIVRIHVVYYWHQVINCIQLHNKNDTVVVNSSVHFNVCIVWTDLIRCHLCLKRHAIEYTWTVCRACRAYGSLHHKNPSENSFAWSKKQLAGNTGLLFLWASKRNILQLLILAMQWYKLYLFSQCAFDIIFSVDFEWFTKSPLDPTNFGWIFPF